MASWASPLKTGCYKIIHNAHADELATWKRGVPDKICWPK